MTKKIEGAGRLRGVLAVPPDKSISHRAVMLASIAQGKSTVKNLLLAADTISTLNAMKLLGADIKGIEKPINVPGFGEYFENYEITGHGLHGLKNPAKEIDCGNSGTTMRLLSGLLAGQPFRSVLVGDESLSKRPMARVIKPLSLMGAKIEATVDGKYPPLEIEGGPLKAIEYDMPVASAQVKSALILAGLYADGKTVIREPHSSRDHTEKMLSSMGARLKSEDNQITVEGPAAELASFDITVPGDFSSAAFFLVGALITENSEAHINNVCLNPTRTGLLAILEAMGAKVEVENRREVSGETVGDIHVKGARKLKAVNVDEKLVPLMIDELPILFIACACAEGRSVIRGAAELRVKESDRIKAMAAGLKAMGIEVEEFEDGLAITGGKLNAAKIDSFGDHRIAMSFAIAALAAKGVTEIEGPECVSISYPEFFNTLNKLRFNG
ncbi:MAG: 3-phosphoshikimate 1-carboxyvinyltransferase [Actinomycetota bacterium]|nr:3-phosphoshikimate 1-carboxyvinyltransferase [Actinomycetota bacterium]